MENLRILVFIPARSGSKGIIDKNIINYRGRPLMSWSIEQAYQSKYRNLFRVVVSTDSQKYAQIAETYGAEVPFLRPAEISGDLSTDYQVIDHALDQLERKDGYRPDLILHLRPTQPCRKVADIDRALDLFISQMDNYHSLRSVIPIKKSPYKMYHLHALTDGSSAKDGKQELALVPVIQEFQGKREPYNLCRQELPQAYLHNGYIDIYRASIIRETGTLNGSVIYPYIMSERDSVDIDGWEDLPT